VLKAAIMNGVRRVVCLSTDKADYPINAMGISKVMMEKVMVAKSRNVDPARTAICCARYSNVMASRGSVIHCSTRPAASLTAAERTRKT
jgi:UDP-glucose 4-epimerase